MDGYYELALESAEIAGNGSSVKEKALSRRVKLLSFTSDLPFGNKDFLRLQGKYHTLVTVEDVLAEPSLQKELSHAVAEVLSLFKVKKAKKVLAVGLGNPLTVVDALGCESVKNLRAGARGDRYLATLVPSVFGRTGVESLSVVRGVVLQIKPDLVLCVDTLATRRAERLSRAVQITDGGILPGGGVGNQREVLNGQSVGVPVLSVGVPLLSHADKCASLPEGLVVTPKEIDLLVPTFASLLAEGVERALFQ